MSEDERRSRRRTNNDGKQPATVFHSPVLEEEDDDEVEVIDVSSSGDVDSDCDWLVTCGSGSDSCVDVGESSDEDIFVEDEVENEKEKRGADDLARLSQRVSRLLLQENGSMEGANLKLEECKAYLRKHGLRVGGTKAVCLERINEHLRIKNGNGEKLYPRSSFLINCTGDVCKGDVVLFTQKVHKSFNKVTGHERVLGRRTIAGRVVKESYGSAKQQHTFTVEVLWSKGMKQLPPLFPLLVKGRNLYKMRTFRQAWEREEERQKVLDEKHKRGSEARHIRAIRISKLDAGRGGQRNARDSKPRRQPQKNTVDESEQRRPFLEHPRRCVKGASRWETIRDFQCRTNSHPILQSYAQDNYTQGYNGQKIAKPSQRKRQPQKNAAAETEQRRPFLEHPGSRVKGTSRWETGRDFQSDVNSHPNLQSYAQDDYSRGYHSMKSQLAYSSQGTTSTTMPGPPSQYYGGPQMPGPPNQYYGGPRLPPYSHSFRDTNDVRYGSFNPRNTSYTSERSHYRANDPRTERRFGQYEHEPRADSRYG